jgi:hypothetical protein
MLLEPWPRLVNGFNDRIVITDQKKKKDTICSLLLFVPKESVANIRQGFAIVIAGMEIYGIGMCSL